MFVTATFASKTKRDSRGGSRRRHLAPARSRLGLCARRRQQFSRVEVTAGDMLPGNQQEILSGIGPGQQVVSNVLQLEATLEAPMINGL